MERVKKAVEKLKRSPVTLDACFRKFFAMDTDKLKEFRGPFEEVIAAQLTVHLRDGRNCINQDIEQPGFGNLVSVIKSCDDNRKTKRKGN